MKRQKMLVFLAVLALMVPLAACSQFRGEKKSEDRAEAKTEMKGEPAAETATKAPATEETAKDVAAVKAALADIVAMLEKGDAKGMVEKYYAPEAVERMKAMPNYDEIVAGMSSGERHDRMLERYKDAQGQTPELNADNTEATFQPATEGGRPVRFQKQGDKWYLRMGRLGGAGGQGQGQGQGGGQ